MKRLLLRVAYLLPIACSLGAVEPFFRIRSQSEDSARDLVGLTHVINQFDPERVYGTLAFTPEYTKSFGAHKVTEKLFGKHLVSDNCSFLRIVGSQVATRTNRDLLADYFGLPTDYQSIVTFDPRIENIIFDLAFYLGLDDILCGLYLRAHAPVVHTTWDLNFCEKVIDRGSKSYLPGYFNRTGVERSHLVSRFTDFIAHEQTPELGQGVQGTIFESLKNAQFSTKPEKLTRLSDLQFALGWNFLQNEDYHFGINIRGAAPTGNRPEGEFLFEPIVGNSHHWELGFGFTAHYQLWNSLNSCENFGFYIDANITHLFGTRQRRTFDLKNRPLSRYMLAERLGVPVVNLFANTTQGTITGAAAPIAQFQNVFTPVANLTTFGVEVSVGGQADITALLNYTYNNFSFDIGYNYWGITCEKIKYECNCPTPLDISQTWALKGDSFVYGFPAADGVPGIDQTSVPLSATQSTATISSGNNTPAGTIFDIAQIRNPGIDHKQFAYYAGGDGSNDTQQLVAQPGQVGGPNTQQLTSKEPVFLTSGDIDLCGARTKSSSNSFFTHISYSWNTCDCWTPYLGVGGKIEFVQSNTNDCTSDNGNDSCQDSAISQWGVWIKGGISFY